MISTSYKKIPLEEYKLITKFTSSLVKHGKKAKAKKITFQILKQIQQTIKINPITFFYIAIALLKPNVGIKQSYRRNNSFVVELKFERQLFTAFKWLKESASTTKNASGVKSNSFSKKIAQELINVYNKKGTAFNNKKKTIHLSKRLSGTLNVRSFLPPSVYTSEFNRTTKAYSQTKRINELAFYKHKEDSKVAIWIIPFGLGAKYKLIGTSKSNYFNPNITTARKVAKENNTYSNQLKTKGATSNIENLNVFKNTLQNEYIHNTLFNDIDIHGLKKKELLLKTINKLLIVNKKDLITKTSSNAQIQFNSNIFNTKFNSLYLSKYNRQPFILEKKRAQQLFSFYKNRNKDLITFIKNKHTYSKLILLQLMLILNNYKKQLLLDFFSKQYIINFIKESKTITNTNMKLLFIFYLKNKLN